MQSPSHDRQKHPPCRRPRLFPAARLLLVFAALSCSAPLLLGCDTVAEITFIKENLTDLTVLGFRHEVCSAAEDPLATCVPPACGRLDFVMETNRNNFVVPNQQLDGLEGRVTPGENFGNSSTDITFAKNWLFQLDAAGLDKTCVDVSDCAENFECRALTDLDLPGNDINISRQVCVVAAELTWKDNSIAFTALGDNPQPTNTHTSGLGFSGATFAVLMDNSNSLIGRGDDNQIDNTQATDLALDRIAAMKSFRAELLDGERSGLLGRSEFGLFDLSGSGGNGVTDVFLNDNSFKTSFLSDDRINATRGGRLVWEAALDGISITTEGASPLWDGLLESARLFSQVDQRTVQPNYARNALLFADSPSDGSSGTVTEQSVIAALNDDRVDARATIVHLDSMAPADKSTRTGPLPEYHAVTCATGGYYVYDVWPKALPDHLRRLGRAYEGFWSIQVEAFASVNGQTVGLTELAPGWYRLASTMTVSLGDRTETFNFSAQKVRDVFNENADAYTDSRLLFEVKAP